MSFRNWLQNLRSARAPSRGQGNHRRRGSFRPTTDRLNLESLEDRCLLTFSPALSYPVGGTAVLVADFNNDTVKDLAVLSSNSVSVLLGNGNGTFQPARTSDTGIGSRSMAMGDFNGDGRLDLATANYGLFGYDGDVSVLLGNGDGTFGAPARLGLDSGQAPQSVAVGDFDGDGTMDLGVTSNCEYCYYGCATYGCANVLLGYGDGGFSGPNRTLLGPGHHTTAEAADLNGDACDDFVTVNDNYDTVRVLLGDSSGYLQGPIGTNYYALSAAAGDLDADGDTDLVTAYYAGVSVLPGNGAGGFSFAGLYATGANPAGVVLGDFNHDGKADVATANAGANDLSVVCGRGDGSFSAAVNSAVGSNPNGVAAGDFNGDGWLDAATVNRGSNDVSVLINDHVWPTPPPPQVSINDVTVTEGNTGTVAATFTASLSFASNVDVTVHCATADITATAGSDYTGAAGDVIIPAGQLSRTFTVAVKGDRLPEPTETFTVNLTGVTNATIGDGQGVGTILDDEPRVSITDVSKKEGNKNQATQFTFTVTLSAAYDQPVTVSFQTVNGTATTGDGDYVGKTGTLTFKPGETSKTITIEVQGDSRKEANETFYLDLFGLSSNALFTKSRGIGTILNDD